MKKRFDDKTAPLYLAIKRRYYDGREMLYHLKRKARFSYNYLADYSYISQLDEDMNLRTFSFSQLMYKATHRFGSSFAQPFTQEESQQYSPGIGQMSSRVEENTSLENGMQFFDINIPIARRILNVLLTAATQNQFSAKYTGFNSDVRTLMFSNSLNFHIQRMLKKGGYFDKVFPSLKFADIVEGTSYLRVDYSKTYSDVGTLQDKIKYTIVPVYEVLDDGRYTTDSYNELDESKFVIQLHTLDKESLIKLLNRFKQKFDEKDIDINGGNIFSYENGAYTDDTEDINALWDKYAIQNYRSVAVLEVFWKDYKNEKSEDFVWQRTFFIANGGELVELLTVESEYVYGLPLIRKKHQIQPNSIFGYTPTSNNINTDLARNTILNGKLHEARRNSYKKLFMSSILANMKDDQNRYWTPYQDQIFNKVPLRLSSGQSIKNLFGDFDTPQMDAQPIMMIDKITQEIKEDFEVPPINPNRTSQGALSEYYRQQSNKFQPMFLAEKMFNKKLVEYIYQILKSYTDEDWRQINELNKTYADGLDLYSFDISKAPNNLVDMGIEIITKNEEEAIKNQQMETLLPLINQMGPTILEDENLIAFLGLREKGFYLPKDREKLTYLKDIYSILNGKISMEDIKDTDTKPSKVILYAQNKDDATGVITKEFTYQNHKMAVELTRDYIVKNRYEFQTLPQEIRSALYTYLDEHTKAMDMQMKATQSKIQEIQQAQMPPEGLPPELAQMQQ